MNWTGNLHAVGAIPFFLRENDPRPAREQFAERYAHGGGWSPFEGFALSVREAPEGTRQGAYAIQYPDDPPYFELARAKLREELILVFPHAWVAIVQPDGSFEISRMD